MVDSENSNRERFKLSTGDRRFQTQCGVGKWKFQSGKFTAGPINGQKQRGKDKIHAIIFSACLQGAKYGGWYNVQGSTKDAEKMDGANRSNRSKYPIKWMEMVEVIV